MALISTLRKRMGKIVVGVVAFSMFAFILTDFLQSNSRFFGSKENNVGEIAGKDISYQEFQAKVDELAGVFAVNQGRSPRNEEMDEVRTQAWNALIIDNAYQGQYESLGIEVSKAELIDMVQGNNIDPQIKQFFTDPNTGQFSKENVTSFLKQMGSAPIQQQQSWVTFERSLKPSRLLKKYEQLFSSTNFVTEAEAKSRYTAQNSNMSVEYVYVPFHSVNDSMFAVSESDMKSYLSSHSEEYQREESRSIDYVVFPIVPSVEDSLDAQEAIAALKAGLANADNDSIYSLRNTTGSLGFRTITNIEEVPVGLVGQEVGTVTDPVLVGNSYAITKLSGVSEGSEAFVRARHILIETESTDESAKTEARTKAESIIKELKAGADFATLAAENSADRSNANNGGDLGWFGENGSFVQPFKDAVFAHKGTGLLPKPVETSFGYHIIQIDEPKTYTVYKVATIEKEIFASEATINEIYRQADELASSSDDIASFKSNAETSGYAVKSAANIGKNDERVGTITEARNIVLWLYNDAEVDKVSDVKEFDDQYVVAVMTGRQMKGTAQLAQVQNEIKTKVLNEKKAVFIKEKLGKITSEEFETVKSEYGEGARTGNADLTLSSNSFSGVGFAPEAVGVAFSLEEGEKTKPFEISNGVLIVKATAKSPAEDTEDYSTYKSQIASERVGRRAIIANFPLSFSPVFVPQSLDNAVKEFAEIEDERYKFF